MGVNFYAKTDVCEKCGRSDGELHLGKASVGWRFTLQANGFRFYKDWPEMQKWLRGKKIYDEYGKKLSRKSFIEWVENRQTITDPETEQSSYMTIVDGYKFYDCEFS